MSGKLRTLTLSLMVSVLSLPLLAQAEKAPERRLDLDEVRTLRAQAESHVALSGDLRARILKLYDSAISSLEVAGLSEAEVGRYERERAGVGRMVEALRVELSRPEREARLGLAENASAEQAEGALARERSRLAANRSALRETERLAEERADARNGLSHRLGVLDQQTESINDELRALAQRDMDPELQRAARTEVLARRDATRHEIEALRGRLALLDARGPLLPLKIDLAQRRMAHSQELVDLLEEATRDLRHQAAERSLQRIREQCRASAEEVAALAGVSVETELLAEVLWGAEGVVLRSEATAKALLSTRKNISDLTRIVQLMRRKFEAFGHRGSLARWWPEIPEDFPRPGDVARVVNQLEQQIPEVQHQLIQLEQQRSAAREFASGILLSLGVDATPEWQRVARALLNTRQDLLDELIQRYGRYSNRLVELETISRNLLAESERVQEFLYERLLWVRSVPRPIIPRLADLGQAFLWVVSWENGKLAFRTVTDAARSFPVGSLGIGLVLGLLLGLRPRIRKRLEQLAERVGNPETDSFLATLETLVHTLLLAAPLPLALYLGSVILSRAADSVVLFSASRALYYVASIAGLLEVTRQLAAPHGMAEAHLGWPSRITRKIHRGQAWVERMFLPLIYVALHFMMAGIRLSSPTELQVYNNSLGRVAFIVAMAALGFSLLELFRPGKGERTADQEKASSRSRRLYLSAFPAIFILTFLPAVLAALGYYITGLLLAYQLLRTLWLAVGLVVFAGLLFRWRTTSQSRLARLSGGSAEPAGGGPSLSAAEAQVKGLFRFVIVLVAALGFFSVWSEALPTLQIMKRVQIWPRIAMLDVGETGTFVSSAAEADLRVPAGPEDAAEGGSGSGVVIPGVPLPTSESSGDVAVGPGGSAPLTLWSLFEAVLAVVITLVLVRNIPGLFELVLRRRALLDAGARVAVSTLVRYVIMIVGMSAAFGLLGISWSKIQWLAAALTFGLGFGLQEIVANFVSGLILLVERPVRVGDAVTIGNLQGRVSRIQIRATTVSLWDRSEMIVPNKEFITTKLINWTLSDSRRRIDIPLRVAYGSDLQHVKDTLVGVARQHPAVFADPAPQALLLDFGDDAIKFELRYFVDFGQGLKTRDELHMAVDKAFREQGIQFALPQLSIQMPRRRGGTGAPGTESAG